MLSRRLIVSTVLVPLLAFAFYLDDRAGQTAPYLLILTILLAVGATWELTRLLRTRSFAPTFLAPCLCAAAVILCSWHWPDNLALSEQATTALSGLARMGIAFAVCLLILFLKAAARYRQPGDNLETLAAELLVVAYVGVLLSMTAQLRWVAGAQAGYLVLGSLVIAVKSGDIGAYTLGRLFGKRKLVPRLSPGKTWMGAVGALAAAALASLAWLQLAVPLFHRGWQPCRWYWSVVYGLILGLVGLLGDLAESLIKRDVDCKDSSNVIPGFGGILDLVDSVLFAGPVAYLLWQVLPLATWR